MSERELLAQAIPADEVELHDGFDLIQYVADCLDRAGLTITPQAGEAFGYVYQKDYGNGIAELFFKKHKLTDFAGWEEIPLYCTAPPRPVCDGNHAAPARADPECWQRPSPVAPVWKPEAPKGWRFTTADFSMLPGRVMFIRDAKEKERWHGLPDIDKERDDGPELYVSGSGMTLQEAFAKACAAAERAQPLPPSPPDSPGTTGGS